MKLRIFIVAMYLVAVALPFVDKHLVKDEVVQKNICRKLDKKNKEQILSYLGQPQEVRHDTIDTVPVTEFCYSDPALVLDLIRINTTGSNGEAPYVSVFFVDDAVHSVKTNIIYEHNIENERYFRKLLIFLYVVMSISLVLMFVNARVNGQEHRESSSNKI